MASYPNETSGYLRKPLLFFWPLIVIVCSIWASNLAMGVVGGTVLAFGLLPLWSTIYWSMKD